MLSSCPMQTESTAILFSRSSQHKSAGPATDFVSVLHDLSLCKLESVPERRITACVHLFHTSSEVFDDTGSKPNFPKACIGIIGHDDSDDAAPSYTCRGDGIQRWLKDPIERQLKRVVATSHAAECDLVKVKQGRSRGQGSCKFMRRARELDRIMTGRGTAALVHRTFLRLNEVFGLEPSVCLFSQTKMRSEFSILKHQTGQRRRAFVLHPFDYGLTTIDLTISCHDRILNEVQFDGTFEGCLHQFPKSIPSKTQPWNARQSCVETHYRLVLGVALQLHLLLINAGVNHAAEYVIKSFVLRQSFSCSFQFDLIVDLRRDWGSIQFFRDVCASVDTQEYIEDIGAILLIGLKDRSEKLLNLAHIWGLLAVHRCPCESKVKCSGATDDSREESVCEYVKVGGTGRSPSTGKRFDAATVELVGLLHDETKDEASTLEKPGVVISDELLVAEVLKHTVEHQVASEGRPRKSHSCRLWSWARASGWLRQGAGRHREVVTKMADSLIVELLDLGCSREVEGRGRQGLGVLDHHLGNGWSDDADWDGIANVIVISAACFAAKVGRIEDSKELFINDQVGQSVFGVEDRTIDNGQAQSAVGGIEGLAIASCALDDLGSESGGVEGRLEGNKEFKRLWPACVTDDDRVALHNGLHGLGPDFCLPYSHSKTSNELITLRHHQIVLQPTGCPSLALLPTCSGRSFANVDTPCLSPSNSQCIHTQPTSGTDGMQECLGCDIGRHHSHSLSILSLVRKETAEVGWTGSSNTLSLIFALPYGCRRLSSTALYHLADMNLEDDLDTDHLSILKKSGLGRLGIGHIARG
ncbi:hypothetical protein KCU65_g378, partial [Aureobasidium melanogenum]